MSTSPQGAITIFFTVVPDDGQCFSQLEVFLWFTFMIAMSCTWSLICGSRDFRQKLRFNSIHRHESRNFFISITGSLVLNASMSVLTAHILTTGGQASPTPLRYLLMAWLTRPLPGVATLLVSVDYNRFRANLQEIILVESIYAVLPIYLFVSIATQSTKFSSRAHDYLSQNKHYHLGFALLRGGVAVNLMAWIILIFGLVVMARTAMKQSISVLWSKNGSGITAALITLSVLRSLGGGLIWVGSVKLSPLNFCPTNSMNHNIMLLWTIVPLVDVLWRGFMGVESLEDDREVRQD